MKNTLVIAMLLITLVGCIVASPQIALHAAKSGFSVWWSYVFPVMLPIYMLISLCKALGLFHSLSYVIIVLFRIPQLTPSELAPYVYRWFMGSTFLMTPHTQEVNSTEQATTANKAKSFTLLTLSYNANPIFVIVIVFTVFIPLSMLGIYIVICLLLATLVSGLYLRSYYKQHATKKQSSVSSLIHAFEQGRKEDGRPIGKLLGEGIYASVQQLFLLGGVILFSSVIAAYLQLLLPTHVQFKFLFVVEQHIAAYALLSSPLPIPIILLLTIAILSFGGCVQLFIMYGELHKLKLSFIKFVYHRLIHLAVTVVLVIINYNWLEKTFQLSSIKDVFMEQQLIMQSNQSLVYILSTSTFVTAFFLLGLIIITNISSYYIWSYYKNKQA